MGAGEGSRGGKVVGHSKSGRPIYAAEATAKAAMGHDPHPGVRASVLPGGGLGANYSLSPAQKKVANDRASNQRYSGMLHKAGVPGAEASPAAGMQQRHEAIRASDAAHAASASVAGKGSSASGSDHTMAASAHLAAAGLADKAGHRLAMQGHQQLAAAHMAAAKGDRPGAAKGFGSYAKDSEHTHYGVLAETEGTLPRITSAGSWGGGY